jgi:hypothetical protein
VAVGVVDALEVVDVDHQQRAAAPGPPALTRVAGRQATPVEHVGERVVVGQPAQLAHRPREDHGPQPEVLQQRHGQHRDAEGGADRTRGRYAFVGGQCPGRQHRAHAEQRTQRQQRRGTGQRQPPPELRAQAQRHLDAGQQQVPGQRGGGDHGQHPC